ncbi:V/A-type H+-transporting ATPase subunit I [Enterococcus sp. PF1-24]|uniref:V-type ATP synthase subunit I n=1 Tax=unclassified Enterococcus TaxID=2608891 RepID=UPI002472E869|nr:MULTISPECIES: V-type ATP synthase subunit I [unclassified Enterococcus]MDH6364763.1 V/A-type H+-transporting ATPase subunit I [Enterococcus sp. PFB1-1]MDH6401892.1 V/A-type H+-transporting ATPase subunit I [Enterococcus sp. PF1-24]
MAVSKMTKVTLISDKSYKETLLQTVQGLQNTEIRDLTKSNESNQWVQQYFGHSKEEAEDSRESDYDRLQQEITESIQFIERYGSNKKQKALYLNRQALSLQEMEAVFDEKKFRERLKKVLGLKQQREQLVKQREDLLQKEEWLTGWQYLDINPQMVNSKFVKLQLVRTSNQGSMALIEKMDTLQLVHLEKVFSDEKEVLLALIYHKQVAEKVQGVLTELGVQLEEYPYEESPKTVLQEVKVQLGKVYGLEGELAIAIGQERSFIKELQWAEEVILALTEREKVKQQLVQARYLVIIQGWLSVDEQPLFTEAIEQQFGKDEIYLAFEEPTELEIEEEVPTKLKNSPLVAPFEMLTEMYALPKYQEIDPTPWMMPFYLVFFGMMVADVGYGLLMLIATVLASKFLVLPRSMERFMKFFKILSFPTIIWGLIYASCFGVALPYQAILSTEDDVIQILIISIIFGFIQLMVGLFVAGKEHLRRKEYLDAIGNGFAWQGILLGIAIGVMGSLLLHSDGIMMAGIVVAVISALAVLVVPILQSKSKVVGAAVGAYNLYGITGYIGDIVSYTRLMALGISGGSIAAAFNLLVDFMPPVARYTVGIVLIVALHALNIFLTLLSAYVHGARLQYVEFFGKFYTGGGRAFKPLKTAEKYVNIEVKEKYKSP